MSEQKTTPDVIDAMVDQFIDNLAAEIYQQRSRSVRVMTEERWANIKAKFPGSARSCREDVLRLHKTDIDQFRLGLELGAKGMP